MSNELPDFVEEDITGAFLDRLSGATVKVSEQPGLVDEAKANKMLTVFAEAGLWFAMEEVWYNGFAPVLVMVPVPVPNTLTLLPPEHRVPLLPEEKLQCQKLAETYASTSENKSYIDSYLEIAKTPGYKLAKMGVSKAGMYYELLENGTNYVAVEAALNSGKMAKSFGMGMVGLTLSGVDLAFDAANVPDGWVRTLTSCSSFVVEAGATMSAPLGLGVLGIFTSAEAFIECANRLVPIPDVGKAIKLAAQYSQKRIIAETMRKASGADWYEIHGDTITLKKGPEERKLGLERQPNPGGPEAIDHIKVTDDHGGPVGDFHVNPIGTECDGTFGWRDTDGAWKEWDAETTVDEDGQTNTDWDNPSPITIP